ncbi:MAG: hypothetical protein H7338_20260, partial [Candidatus Sericytochromatia bacterium]|nr:hypothetical protein [Candidatus Sericytochromatia bacterium]
GAISVGRHGISPAGLVTVGVIAGMASWLTAECMADNSGPRGTSPEMVRMAIGLRSRH